MADKPVPAIEPGFARRNLPLPIARFPDKETAAQAAGEKLDALLAQFSDIPALLLLSAGSALDLLKDIQAENLGPNLTIGILDERFSQDPKVNNFMQLQKTPFYEAALGMNCNFLGTAPRPREGMEDFAKRWETGLKNWQKENSGGKIIATFGMGADGHIAGIFPFPEDAAKFNRLFNGGNWIAAYSAAGKNRYAERATATPVFFKQIDYAISFICGQEKKQKFGELAERKGAPSALPALYLWDLKNLEIFTDIKA